MNPILVGFSEAFNLLFSFDEEIWSIIFLSFQVSGIATLISVIFALPLGSYMGLQEFRWKKTISTIINTCMGFPTVVLGLIVFLLLSKSGPLGNLALLYSPVAMIIAQILLTFPIILGTTKAAVESVSSSVKELLLSLGSTRFQLWKSLLLESRKSTISGVIMAFGRAISEVGAVMIVGGNIRWYTRTFTTAIIMQTRMGDFGMAIALGMILLLLTFIINIFLTHLQTEEA
ncbi:MAG: tungstate transporter permease [Promethearchaeia archaeon]|nr:MAG: tungstate transporter permease [Candidatus Lokiarchaeia archaeon]